MANDSGRVDPPALFVGRSLPPSPQSIEELTRQAQRVERMLPGKPTKPFASVLGDGAAKVQEAAPVDAKETKRRALPKKGPRPSLVHPAQREAYGRDGDTDEAVVLKG